VFEYNPCNDFKSMLVYVQGVSNTELPAYYQMADCLCNPSRWEGFGIVFIEALAAGAVCRQGEPFIIEFFDLKKAFLVCSGHAGGANGTGGKSGHLSASQPVAKAMGYACHPTTFLPSNPINRCRLW
jgi:hypothetical protein